MPWLTSAWRNSKSGFPSSVLRFSREPVMKLSSASTRMPRARSASHRCEPMNPAPPEITARGLLWLLAANSSVGEAQPAHHRRVVDVAAVDHDRLSHRPLDAAQVQETELVPLRDHDQRIRTGRDLVSVVH